MAHTTHLKLFFCFLFLVIPFRNGTARQALYKFNPYPDVWYNNVDGIRLGFRIIGEQAGTFKDGPHRLDAGIWLGTRFPEHPVSYYASLTEPIPFISDFGSEGSIQFISSIRTGFSQHRVQFNKRWQLGFDELSYFEISAYVSQEKIFDVEYRQFPTGIAQKELAKVADSNFPLLWDENWKSILGTQFVFGANQKSGQFLGAIDIKTNLNSQSKGFSVGTVELKQRFDVSDNFKLRLRGFAGIGSDNIPAEYRFFVSMDSPINWLNSGIYRAKGTIPQNWLESGLIGFSGGGNLRGYSSQDGRIIEQISKSATTSFYSLYESIWAINIDLEYPTPINKSMAQIPIVGELISMRTYVFFDFGQGYQEFSKPGFENSPAVSRYFTYEKGILADAGTGLQISLNIPDYLGKDRGVFIQYDVPLWLSDPSGLESNFSYRQIIGIGGIISF